jgi:indole-3-glycerol phosphate synthase
MNGNVLERIVESTRDEVRRRQASVPLRELEQALAHRDDRPFSEALTRTGVSLIAEHKRRSPSAGTIREGATVSDVVQAYELGGAAAVSILTEGAHFAGSLDDLREARDSCHLPVLRKDFIVDVYQVYETAAAGADALLLICAALSVDDLTDLYGEAQALDLDVLVEVHDERELELALEAIDADVIGINNRDLTDFSPRSPRARRWCPSRASTAATSSTTSSASASTRSSSARRSCARATWRTPSARSSGTRRYSGVMWQADDGGFLAAGSHPTALVH